MLLIAPVAVVLASVVVTVAAAAPRSGTVGLKGMSIAPSADQVPFPGTLTWTTTQMTNRHTISPNLPDGPIPELHVGPNICRDWWRTDCGEIHTGTNTDMYYTFYGNVVGGVSCTESPWGHLPNVHFPYDGSNAHWTVSCRDSVGNGFDKTWHVLLPQPPGPVPELHIGNWVCHDWYPSDCGTIHVARGTDMYYTFYGNAHGAVVCTEKPWGHLPNQHFPYPGLPPAATGDVWYVLCLDSFEDGFDKQVRIIPQ